MKRLFALFIFALLFGMLSTAKSNAQSFQIVDVHDSVYLDDEQTFQAEAEIDFKNVSFNKVKFKIKIIMTSLETGHSAAFCAGDLCYPEKKVDWEAPVVFEFDPGQSAKEKWSYFKAYLYPNGFKGNSIVTFRMTNVDNPNDYLDVPLHFFIGLSGIKEIEPKFSMNVFPNPAQNFVNISFDNFEPNSIMIYDNNGKLVTEQIISNEKSAKIDVANLANGNYFIVFRKNSNFYYADSFVINR